MPQIIMSIRKKSVSKKEPADVWVRPGMQLIFRAELMPGKSREERAFRVAEVLPNNRVLLAGFAGERRQSEFEPLNFKRLSSSE